MEDLRPKTILFCAVLALAIALSVLLRGRRAVHWLFAAFAADIALWYASQSFSGFFRPDLWERVTGVLTVLLPQFAIHLFQNVVPREAGARSTPLARFAAIVGVPVLVVSVSPYHDRPFALGAVYTYVFGLLAAALITLARQGQRNPSRAVRDRVRFLVAVGAAATTFSLADFLSYLGVHLPPIGAVLAIVFLFVLAESVTRARLADIYELAGRLLVSTALAFCLAAIFYLFVMVIGGFETMYLNAVLAAIVFLVLFEPLQTEAERRIHQFFFRERYDLETSVAELRKLLAHVLEIDEMVTTLMTGLDRSRRVTTAAIYLRDQDGDGFDLLGSIGTAVPKRVESLTTRPLLDRLDRQASLSLEEVAREANRSDSAVRAAAEALGTLQSAVVLAIRGEQEGTVGLIFAADDRVRDAFTPEEIALLETIASQIGVVVTNSRVYSRMKERDRLAALGSMAAGLAHEVKNPLGAIKGAAQLLEEVGASTPDDPDRAGVRGDHPRGGQPARSRRRELPRLRAPARGQPHPARHERRRPPHRADPLEPDHRRRDRRAPRAERADAAHAHRPREVPAGAHEPHAERHPGDGRPRQDHRVDRRCAARPRARLPSYDGSAPPSRRSLADERELVEVGVRDTGPGISPKVLRNLFIPFFTTKTQGTGLGLAISQSIVQNAGGMIEVQSQPGAGTTFTIVLPSAGDSLSTPVASDVSLVSSRP